MPPKTDWNPILKSELQQAYWSSLQSYVAEERSRHSVYPPADEVFSALHLTPFANVKVVILGQDPYHGPNQANGLAFSVREGIKIPPSLQNIYKELESDVGVKPPNHGALNSWAREGVLLLNTTLTVRSGEAASHQNQGWETFTDQIIRKVASKPEPLVFILWGASARKKSQMLDSSFHCVIESAHPSPLSAHRGFLGSKPFSKANEFLKQKGLKPVDWSIS